MRIITLDDNQTFEVAQCGASQGYLWIVIMDYPGSISDALATFSNEEATRRIFHSFDGNDEVTFEGYTELAEFDFQVSNSCLRVALHQRETT